MTLAELMVASGITLAVTAAVAGAVVPASRAFDTVQETADLQQRLRIASGAIVEDIRAAGLILPYRSGAIADDAAAGVRHRPDVITVLLGPADDFVLGGPRPISRTYTVTTDSGTPHLMRYDGLETTLPVADNVSLVRFEYFGVAESPALVTRRGIPAATYGPSPPPLTVDDARDSWPPGENCAWRVVGGIHTPRLASLPGAGLVPLSAAVLTDGPWCPDADHVSAFDADVLRIRLVRVRVRVQPAAAFRAAPGVRGRFTHQVRDEEIEVDVAPRNVSLGWQVVRDAR